MTPDQLEGVGVHYASSIDEVLDIAFAHSKEEAKKDAEMREQVLADAKA